MVNRQSASGSLLLAVLFLRLATTAGASLRNDAARQIDIINQSEGSLAVDWLNPATGAPREFIPHVSVGETVAINSFVNHTLLIRLVTEDNHTDVCQAESRNAVVSQRPTYPTANRLMGKSTSFVVHDDETVLVKQGLQVTHVEHRNAASSPTKSPSAASPSGGEAADITQGCRDQVVKSGLSNTQAMLDALVECLEQKTADALISKQQELAFQSQLRLEMSYMAENYTCADKTKETTEPREIRQWKHASTGKSYQARILHDRPSSQIHVIPDFITPEECAAITQAAAVTLHRGTVADGKGGSKLSEHRKAWQAGVKVPWDKVDHPITRVSQRLYDYTNHATGFNLTTEGQEDLMSIQYFGQHETNVPSTSDAMAYRQGAPDQYMPHCDGACDGMPHKRGGRVATMVMYCEVPAAGSGATNFQHANVFVKPQLGAAAFFSYMDPNTHVQETGFTTHSGCPVWEGTKRIAVQWMRIGVDAKDPWDSFDTNTISNKLREAYDDEEESEDSDKENPSYAEETREN